MTFSHRYLEEKHLQNFTKVLDKFKEYGVRVKQDKCKFMSASVENLGHRFDPDGINAMESKLEATCEALTPHNIQELGSFFGLLDYFASFIPTFLHSFILQIGFYAMILIGNGRKAVRWLSMQPKKNCYHPTYWYIVILPYHGQ